MPKNLYVAWQDQDTRAWHTFARLRRIGGDYELVFTRGAERLQSIPMNLFNMDLSKRYKSEELIPLFQNRLPSRSRSDFRKMAKWLNLSGDENQFDLLSRFGLIPGTDSILIYPEPKIDSGEYHLEFFVHGIRHMGEEALKHCGLIGEGDRLLPVLDVQNPADQNAVALRREGDSVLIGYAPAFYASDLKTLLSSPRIANSARITTVRNNEDAPTQLRLLCRFVSTVTPDFRALDTEEHKILVDEAAA